VRYRNAQREDSEIKMIQEKKEQAEMKRYRVQTVSWLWFRNGKLCLGLTLDKCPLQGKCRKRS
jgi:hypothetical protein